jgi:hypothetical protein
MFEGTLDSAGTAVNVMGGVEDGFVAKYGFACSSGTTNLSPLQPTSLSAAYQPSLTNLVSWIDNSNYETAYELWVMGGSASNFSLLATLPANTVTYLHSGLSHSTTYCYKARAINNVGPSYYTNIGCAATPPPGGTVTALYEKENADEPVLFPNPTSGQLNVVLLRSEGGATIEVFDQLGEKKSEEYFTPESSHEPIHIDMPEAKGIYMVKIRTKDAQVYTRKIVVE